MVNLARWERIGRGFMCLWVLLAVPTAVSVLGSGITSANLAVVFAFSVWAGIWIWFWVRALGHSHRAEVVGFVAQVVLLTLFTVMAPTADNSFLVFAFVVAGAIFPVRQVGPVFAGLVVLQVALGVLRLAGTPVTLNLVINAVLVGVLGVGARLFWLAYIQLGAARDQLAALAVTEERLRFARDLHDLLGQSLSVLVLKSELVSKELPADADEQLRGEVRDIAQVARKSLNDVRDAVAGYRLPTLQAEISSARTALRAAGIGLLVEDNNLGALPPEQDGVLAWCLREAVTNVVRHSGARKCEVRLVRADGLASLEVADDGRGAASLNGGSGLAGMRERVELVGGSLDVGNENGGGLHIRVSVPQPA